MSATLECLTFNQLRNLRKVTGLTSCPLVKHCDGLQCVYIKDEIIPDRRDAEQHKTAEQLAAGLLLVELRNIAY